MIAEEVVKKLIEKGETISSMESCTGGHFADALTNVEGASSVIEFAAVTYSNKYKVIMRVDKEIIEKYGVYSFATSRAMAKQIAYFAESTYGIGITGKINKVDENNLMGEDNVVYATIYNSKTHEYRDLKMKCPDKSRKVCKELLVNRILKRLLEIIGD